MANVVQLPALRAGSVILDGDGFGVVRLGPDNPGEHWRIDRARVSCETAEAEAECRNYGGTAASPQFYIDGTASGSTGDSTDKCAEHDIAQDATPCVWAIWSGGDPGTRASLELFGERIAR